MSSNHLRMIRENRTVEAMIHIYCRGQHRTQNGPCSECAELLDYARTRLRKCAFQEGKTTCAKCPIHCYKPDMRERIRAVMRYAGPRMLIRHPVLALLHLVVDSWRKEPLHSPEERPTQPSRDRPEPVRSR
jgi:hypothetical protein